MLFSAGWLTLPGPLISHFLPVNACLFGAFRHAAEPEVGGGGGMSGYMKPAIGHTWHIFLEGSFYLISKFIHFYVHDVSWSRMQNWPKVFKIKHTTTKNIQSGGVLGHPPALVGSLHSFCSEEVWEAGTWWVEGTRCRWGKAGVIPVQQREVAVLVLRAPAVRVTLTGGALTFLRIFIPLLVAPR